MPKFEATFVLYRDNEEIFGEVKPKEFYTESDKQGEFWGKLQKLERELSEEYKGSVCHLIVTALEDLSEAKIKKGDIVACNTLAL